MMKWKTIAGVVTGILFILRSENIFTQSITIDFNTEYQRIAGFGGMNHTTWIRDLDEDSRVKAFGNNPGQLGLSILRIHLDPNPNRFNLELPTAKHAISHGALVFATPWNAPSALLDPANPGRVDPAKYSEYVKHLNSFNNYMSTNGAPLYAISVQNEPDFGEWTRWTSDEMLDFVRNYAQDIENKVMAPESFQFRRKYTDPLLNDSIAASHIDIIGGHIYGGGLYDYPLAREKGKEVWMTEHLLGSGDGYVNDWNLALTVGKEISDCMKANFSAYVWWYIRRFYGLIDEANNITDKGYVMSHFSKFIRPNAIRIGAEVSLVSNIEATAYKTDTSLVIVVINLNYSAFNLNFNVQNGNINKLTKFTTSEIKSVLNEGDIPVISGSFSSSIDARSITTFTTNSANGGKYGNFPPEINLGNDLVVGDTNKLGSIQLNFNKVYATDHDGDIVNYNWSMNDKSISNTETVTINAKLGENKLILTVTDNDGAAVSDTLNIALIDVHNTEIWIEAECGEIGQAWNTAKYSRASNDYCVLVSEGTESLTSAPTNSEDHINYNFNITEPGLYKVWGRVISPSDNENSFWIKMDNEPWINWEGLLNESNWYWDDVHDQLPASPVTFNLTTGKHTLTIAYRENSTLLDKLLITNTGIIPSSSGGDSEVCLPNITDISLSNKLDYNIFPNPSNNEIRINSDFKFHTIEIITMDGNIVFHESNFNSLQNNTLKLNLSPGIYIVAIRNDNIKKMKKIIIN